MRPTETIKLRSAEPPASKMLGELAARSWNFTAATEELVIFEAEFTLGASQLPRIEQTLEQLNWHPKVYYSVSPNFEQADFDQAELAMVSAPDVYDDALPKQTRQCSTCRKRIKPRQLIGTIAALNTTKPIFVLNGEAFIVSKLLAAEMRKSGLMGYKLSPVDSQETFFQIVATRDLLEQIIEPNEVLEYEGNCPSCGWPQFKVYFGPGRLQRDGYSEEDFIWTSFFGGELLMSHRALDFFRGFHAELTPLRPVRLQ
jgi:hypothetical protein